MSKRKEELFEKRLKDIKTKFPPFMILDTDDTVIDEASALEIGCARAEQGIEQDPKQEEMAVYQVVAIYKRTGVTKRIF